MNLIKEICEEPCIKALGIKHWTSIDLIKRIGDLLAGHAFVVFLEKLQGEKLEIIVRPEDDLDMVWKAICSTFGKQKIGVNSKNLKRKYSLTYKDQIFEKHQNVESLGIAKHETLKFRRKPLRHQITR